MTKPTTRNPEPPPSDPSDPLFAPAMSPETNAAANALSKALTPQTEIAPGTFAGEGRTSVARSGFAELETTRESRAVAETVRAQIAARTLHAMQHPRSFMESRAAILADCKRPSFAKAAIYRKPVAGTNIEGLSIRFAESALRHWGNVYSQSMVVYDGADKRQLNIFCSDLETNTTHARDIVLMKTVERSRLRQGQVPVGERIGSNGQTVYEVPATEDELQVKEGAARAKVLRNEGLRLIPADILEEAFALCKATRGKSDEEDPTAARKEIADGFAEIGVKPGRLEEYLGCPLDECGPAQIGELREIYRAVRDGDATISEFIEARVSDLQGNGNEEKPSSSVASLKDRAKANAEKRKAAAQK
jgi:hypothetical protein